MEINKKKIQSEQSVRHIIMATITLMADNGYGNTSISDISAATGLTKGALYHHFNNKEELFERSIAYIADIFRQKLIVKDASTMSCIQKLNDLFESVIEIGEENYIYLLIISSMVIEMDTEKNSFAEPLRQLLADLSRFIERTIEQGQANREINSDFEGKLLSLNILGIMFGSTIPWLLNKYKTNYRVIIQSQKAILLKSLRN